MSAIDPQLETAPFVGEPGSTDAVTVSFGDPATGVCGLVRLAVADSARGSALALVFVDGVPHPLAAEGALDAEGFAWADGALAGVRHVVRAPLSSWSLDGAGLALSLEAVGDALEVVLPAGGMVGYEQLVTVRGTIAVPGAERPVQVDALGQRGHLWGRPEWDGLQLVRNVSAWGQGAAVLLSGARSRRARSHADEERWGAVLGPRGPIGELVDPRVSTTYDEDGRQVRAGLELWVAQGDAEHQLRATGTAFCGTTLDLGELRMDLAFFRWTLDGRPAIGRYDVLRRATTA